MKRAKTTPIATAALAAGALLATIPTGLAQRDRGGAKGDGAERPTRDGRPGQEATTLRRAAAAPIPQPRRDPKPDRGGSGGSPLPADGPRFDFPAEERRIDGYGNNLADPERGMADVPFLRSVAPDYADGVGEPGGAARPSPRAVSNAVCAQTGDVPNRSGASDFVWQWGQFLDHDIDETPTADPAEAFDIAVPAGDPWFDPAGTGAATIALNRSAYEEVGGVRQQVNAITAYIDASNVYGSDEERAFALRTLDGTGRLKTSEGDLLPFNTGGLANAPSAALPNFYLAGDVRANEQVGLTAMHTVFVREHNHWAATMREANPRMSGMEIYGAARAIVAAEMQAITYNEFLPVLLGPGALPPYRGYREEVDAGIANLFAAAAYRLGHSMLSGELLCLDADLREIDSGNLSLASSFFDPALMQTIGPDPILRGLCAQRCQEIDTMLVDEVRNFLFGAPGSPGFDLASLNIQRGRDHGLPSYSAVRVAYGLPPVRRFADITPDRELAGRLASVYAGPADLDLWVGLLAEPHAPGAMVGETLRRVLADQFIRLRDGDRFWYQNHLTPELAALVEEQTLARILRRNTGIGAEIGDDVFRVAN